jgi:hypothetical protein
MRNRSGAILTLTLLTLGASGNAAFGQEKPRDAPIATVTVDAKHPWVDAGLDVRKGDRLSFEADGRIQWGAEPDQVAGPEGHGAKSGKLGVGGLIGRVGQTGKPFAIGNTRTPLAISKTGRLWLGINDFVFRDNAGAFVVKIFQARDR